MCTTGYPAGLLGECKGLLSRVTVQPLFMLTWVFPKELFLVLLYINDITTNITSSTRLFADDCVLYCVINSEQDHHLLQQDLNRITQCTKQW